MTDKIVTVGDFMKAVIDNDVSLNTPIVADDHDNCMIVFTQININKANGKDLPVVELIP